MVTTRQFGLKRGTHDKKTVALYTEVEQYIACGNEPFQRDVVVVWAGISKRFPILAKIAQDVFSCLCKLHPF